MIIAIAAVLMLGLTVLALNAAPQERRVPVRVERDREDALPRRETDRRF